MPFDKPTRTLLAKTVAACRDSLVADISDQLQSVFGLYPDGSRLEVARSAEERRAAAELGELLDYYASSQAVSRAEAYQRLVREIGFTTLNRLAALRLCEERGLVIECVRRGTESDGFRLFDRLAGGALGGRYAAYRAFLEGMYDELALDLGMLFDRRGPLSRVFPGEAALSDVLARLTDPELEKRDIWRQDETIGWIYQYYNDPTERKKMRDESQAPRNSRELAVRNQFFTPRYVVEFLTDNTLGRTWYEMRRGQTRLVESCRYLVRRPQEIFLSPEETPPPAEETEDPLQAPLYILHRALKDPRELKILDPACGSGHFLLYAFDLLLEIYEEAWEDPALPPFDETGSWLRQDYPAQEALRKAAPGMILRHNLHGIDIDPRAAQIAALALWLRAQRTYQEQGLKPAERPRIEKSNIVVAEPMPGDTALLEEFIRDLPNILSHEQHPEIIGPLVRKVFEKMKLAGEAGSLLKIEQELSEAIESGRKAWASRPEARQLALLPEAQKPQQLALDVSGVTDEAFWLQAEGLVLQALSDYANQAENGHGVRRRLFAGDAAQGFAFIDLCRSHYSVVLMNPPFGEPTPKADKLLRRFYPDTWLDIYAAFAERAFTLGESQFELGMISSKTFFYAKHLRGYRQFLKRPAHELNQVVDLSFGVLDAVVEVAIYTLSRTENFSSQHVTCFIDLSSYSNDEFPIQLERIVHSPSNFSNLYTRTLSEFDVFPFGSYAYWAPNSIVKLFGDTDPFEPSRGDVVKGLTTFDDFRFTRMSWEVAKTKKARWRRIAKGGGYSLFYLEHETFVDWYRGGEYLQANEISLYNTNARTTQSKDFWFRAGLTFSEVSTIGFSVQPWHKDCLFGGSGFFILAKDQDHFLYLAIYNSHYASRLLTLLSTDRHWSCVTVGSLPIPHMSNSDQKILASNARTAWRNMATLGQISETSSDFTFPAIIHDRNKNLRDIIDEETRIIQSYFDNVDDVITKNDAILCNATGIDIKELTSLKAFDHGTALSDVLYTPFDSDKLLGEKGFVRRILAFAIGSTYGRWDNRPAFDTSFITELSDPFSNPPICPPGMLVGPDGLPAKPGHIVSEAWLRARPDAITMPALTERGMVLLDGQEYPATILDSEYPLTIQWDGILVDDPGLDGKTPHAADIVRRVEEALCLLWPDTYADIEAEACQVLGVKDLREYFRKPGGFFADHLKRYSKSRRQAPIYWPLSTPSGSYTLWIYYHRLSADILYTAVNRYVEPKIAQVERTASAIVERLNAPLSGSLTGKSGDLRETHDLLQAHLAELRAFRDELLRIAALPYKPDLNDGVIINAAPFHKLFRLGKWVKATEATWQKLEHGDYDWAHLAYVLWPERVREKCKEDKSLAIAHELEALYVEKPGAKKKGKRKPQEEMEI